MLEWDLFPLSAIAHLLQTIPWSSSPQLPRIHRLHRQPESSGLWSIFSYSQRPQKCICKKNVRVIREYLFWTQLVSSTARQKRKLHTFSHINGKIHKDLSPVSLSEHSGWKHEKFEKFDKWAQGIMENSSYWTDTHKLLWMLLACWLVCMLF